LNSHEELQYSKKVVEYNEIVANGGIKPDLMQSFASLFPEDTKQVNCITLDYQLLAFLNLRSSAGNSKLLLWWFGLRFSFI
jgi:hypothetical protein